MILIASLPRRSRPLVGIVVELADNAGGSGLRCGEVIAPVAVAAELALLAQRIERASDLAPILAADPFDDVGVEHRPGPQRLLDRLEACRALEHLGRAAGQ